MPPAITDTLLLIEDEDLLGEELTRHLRREGWEVACARTIVEARRLLVDKAIDPLVVLSDMSLPDGNALDLLEGVKGRAPHGEWVFLTGYGTISDSVRGVRLGAYDFLEKPCDLERLDLVVASAARSARAQRRIREQSAEQNRRYALEAFVGRSAAARRVRDLLARLAEVPFSGCCSRARPGPAKGSPPGSSTTAASAETVRSSRSTARRCRASSSSRSSSATRRAPSPGRRVAGAA